MVSSNGHASCIQIFSPKTKTKKTACLNVVVSAMQYSRRGETCLKTRLKIIIQNRHFYKRLESICMIPLHIWFRWHMLETLDKRLRSRFQEGQNSLSLSTPDWWDLSLGKSAEYHVTVGSQFLDPRVSNLEVVTQAQRQIKAQETKKLITLLGSMREENRIHRCPKDRDRQGKTGHYGFLEQKFTGRDQGRN